MTKIFLFLFITSAIQSNAQYLFMKSITEMEGVPELVKKMGRSTTLSYVTKDKTKSETTVMKTTNTILTEKDKVTSVYPDLCGIFTKEELQNDGLNDAAEYKDVTLKLTDETQQILGYKCKKAVLTYKIVKSGVYDYETILWYTNEIAFPAYEKLPQLTKSNEFTRQIEMLEGPVLYMETLMKINQVKTIMKVIEVSTAEITDDKFLISDKPCKKPMNLEEYKKELKKREHRANTGF